MTTAYLYALSLALFGLIASAVILHRRLRVSDLSPATASLAMMGAVFVARPMALAIWPDFARPFVRNQVGADGVEVGAAYFLLWLAVWTFVILAMLWRQPAGVAGVSPDDPTKVDLVGAGLRYTGLVTWVAMFLWYVVAPGKLASLHDYFSRAEASGLIIKPFAAITIIGSTLVAYRIAQRRAPILRYMLVQSVLCLALLGLGGRGMSFFMVFLPLLVYLCTRYGRISYVWLTYILVPLLTLAGIVWLWRANRSGENLGADVKLVVYGLSQSTGNRFDYYMGVIHACSQDPAKQVDGRTYAFLFMRPFQGFSRLTNDPNAPGPGVKILVGESPQGAVPVTAIAEGFYNFGVFGLLLSAVIHGVFVGFAEKALRSGRVPMAPVWQVCMSLAAVAVFKGWFQQSLSSIIPLLMLLITVSLLVGVRSPRVAAAVPQVAPAED